MGEKGEHPKARASHGIPAPSPLHPLPAPSFPSFLPKKGGIRAQGSSGAAPAPASPLSRIFWANRMPGFHFAPDLLGAGPFLGSCNSFFSSFPWEPESPQLTESREASAAGNSNSGNVPPNLPQREGNRDKVSPGAGAGLCLGGGDDFPG